jgi:hypothetical protein
LIEARNSHVSEGLKRAYAEKVARGTLDVFCISNKHYEKFCRKGNVEYVKKTGIPELRRFCHSITAAAQFIGAKHYVQSRVPGLLNSIRLLAEKEPREEDTPSEESKRSVLNGLQRLEMNV